MSASAIQSVIDSVAVGMFLLLPLASGMALVLFGRDVKRRSGPIGRGRLITGNVLGVLFLLSLLAPKSASAGPNGIGKGTRSNAGMTGNTQ